MAHGLTISTTAGTITLLPGRLSDRLADELSQGLRLELMRREARENMGRAACINPAQFVEAVDRWVNDYNAPVHRTLLKRSDGMPTAPDEVWAGAQA
jgi:hypothetical protein